MCFRKKSELRSDPLPIELVTKASFESWLKKQTKTVREWVLNTDFKAKPNSIAYVPEKGGRIARVLVGVESLEDMWAIADLPYRLPEGAYAIDTVLDHYVLQQMVIGWGLGAYQFTRFKKVDRKSASLLLPETIDHKMVANTLEALYLVRDLINLPASQLAPMDLADVAAMLSEEHHAKFVQVSDDDFLEKLYPATYMIGLSGVHSPLVIDLTWGNPKDQQVTLIGKGVCFDTGGLNLKPERAMALMKKDMAGAAHALGLAKMIMSAHLPISLRVLIPAIENSVSRESYRPGDVIRMRDDTTVEVKNTDAEGRLLLSDVLIEATLEKPNLIIDFSTLTGAARAALGTEIPALFTNHDKLIEDILKFAHQEKEPAWQMPLYEPYSELLKSDIADVANCGDSGYGDAIIAALFLKRFVPNNTPWLHIDMMAWNVQNRPGRPKGGEAQLIRTLFAYLRHRYSAKH